MRRILFSLWPLVLLLLAQPHGYKAVAVAAAHDLWSSVGAGLTPSLIAPQTRQAEIAAIESYARGLDRHMRRSAGAARYFADTSSYEGQNARARWQEFRTKTALDKAWRDAKTYTSSNVWLNPTGEPVVALFTYSSPSGDWAQYVTNYYRSDGTLAKSSSELRTFMGDLIVIRARLYDARGKLIREQNRYLDLKTRKPRRVKAGDFMDREAPLYAKTGELPFYNLLKKR